MDGAEITRFYNNFRKIERFPSNTNEGASPRMVPRYKFGGPIIAKD
jgi:hypothetical protein